MLKKIILGTIFIGLIAVLVIGATNRTIAKSDDPTAAGSGRNNSSRNVSATVAETGGNGRDQGRLANDNVERQAYEQQNLGQQWAGYQGGRNGQTVTEDRRQYPNYQEAPEEWITYEGTIAQLPATGVELIVDTVEGEIVIGTGPLDLAAQGMKLNLGDQIQVDGYWENDEFKAAGLTLVATGDSITLRDELGRPIWSGSGRNRQW